MAKKTHNVAALAHGTNNAAVAAEHSEKKNPNRKQIRNKKHMRWFDQIIINTPNNEKKRLMQYI